MVVVTDNKSAPEAPPPSYDASVDGRAAGSSTYRSGSSATSTVGSSATHGYSTFVTPSKQPDPRDIGYSAPQAPKAVMSAPMMNPQSPDAGRTVYYYRNPVNGATITSFFPPDHPRSLCVQHGHLPHTTHGILGVLAAVLFFPLGVLLCMVDRRSVCARCGEVLSDGCS